MNYSIVCEGKTDSILISYYLVNVLGWKYTKTNKNIDIPYNKNTQTLCYYENKSNNLIILSVGGNGGFEKGINDILLKNSIDAKEAFSKIIIIMDIDMSESCEILLDALSNKIEGDFKIGNNRWDAYTSIDDFGNEFEIEVAGICIPFNGSGALETFLLDALSEDEERKPIIDKADAFVTSINSSTYISTNRLKLKAKLGVSFAIFSPDKVFTRMDDLLNSIEWQKYNTINEGFKILNDL